jgi:hypothetical protein
MRFCERAACAACERIACGLAMRGCSLPESAAPTQSCLLSRAGGRVGPCIYCAPVHGGCGSG